VRYRIDPDRSEISAVLRPQVDSSPNPRPATIAGVLDVSATGDLSGHVIVTVGESDAVELDVAATRPELEVEHDGQHRLLRGSATRPAGAFGVTGPPLLNPTVVLRWRAVLIPVD
jgi:hypothetical protein